LNRKRYKNTLKKGIFFPQKQPISDF
jgi:hypothetical protein